MFEEVPCERRGMSRWLPARRVVLGPFVLGGGMLLAAVGGSVAVATAATVLTATAIGSDDLPARPEHPVPVSTSSHPAPVRSPASRHTATPPSASPSAAGRSSAVAAGQGPAAGASPAGVASAAGVSQPAATTAPRRSPAGSTVAAASPSVPPPASASPSPEPSSSGPLGNALIHLTGYDPATGRFSYQFAAVDPDGARGDGSGYLVSSPDTYTAALAPTATIVSGGSVCPPAGSDCTPDQLIAAAGSGVFAEVAIDAAGLLRSVVEVGEQPVAAKMAPVPSVSASSAESQAASS